jgi:LCP family protein required for cell wall assembly
VETPSYTTKSGTVMPARPGKFNAAYSYGGPQLLVKQVEQLTRLPVDHYVGVDFNGFVNIVNALGGVNVCISAVPGSTTNLRDPGAIAEGTLGSGFVGHVGNNHLSGLNALAFVRQRHGLPQGDLDRIQRQHRFLAAIFSQVKSAGTLLNPLKLNRVVSALAKDVSKDNGTNIDDLVTLGTHLQGLSGNKIEFFTLPNTRGPNVPGIGDVQLPIVDQDKVIIQAIHDDQDPAHPVRRPSSPSPSTSPSSEASPALTIAPSSISLAVENASGITGKGTQAGDALTNLGFHIPTSSITTSAGPAQTQTTVRYGTARADSARTLAAAVPGAVLQPDPSLGSQQLILDVGTSYTGARGVQINPSAAPLTTAPASPTPSPTAPVVPDAKGAAAGGCGP